MNILDEQIKNEVKAEALSLLNNLAVSYKEKTENSLAKIKKEQARLELRVIFLEENLSLVSQIDYLKERVEKTGDKALLKQLEEINDTSNLAYCGSKRLLIENIHEAHKQIDELKQQEEKLEKLFKKEESNKRSFRPIF